MSDEEEISWAPAHLLSDSTVGLLSEELAGSSTKSAVDRALVKAGVFVRSELEELRQSNKADTFTSYLEAIYTRPEKVKAFLSAVLGIMTPSQQLRNALRLEGLDLSDTGITSLAGKLAEPAKEYSRLEISLRNTGLYNLLILLEDGYKSYVDKKWHSSNAMNRTILEGICMEVARRLGATKNQSKRFSEAIQFLREKGFLAGEVHSYLDHLYGFLGHSGSHYGISDESDARLKRFVVVAACLVICERLASWKPKAPAP